MPHRQLSKNPNLAHLRNQARDLRKGQSAGDPAVLQRIREFHPGYGHLTDAEIIARPLKLSDAQLAIAREYTYASWARLKTAIESQSVPDPEMPLEDRIEDPVFREAVRCIDTGDVDALKRLLQEHPKLVKQHVYYNAGAYFGQPGLLQFVAQNPIRQESMPNAVAITQVIIDAGATREDMTDTLGLVATGRVPREEGVQVPLIELLCKSGAVVQSLKGVLAHGEFEAAEALLRNGATMTLPAAAALNRWEDFERLLPLADREDRHLALALAAQFGRTRILQALISAGEDLNRYNPPGAHSHSTPLHQAVIHNQTEAVNILLKSGARTDIPDTLFNGTALGWAEYAKLPDMVAILQRELSGKREMT